MKKKILSFFTVLSMTLSSMAVTSFATVEHGSNSCGGAHQWVDGRCTNTGADGINSCNASCDHEGTLGNYVRYNDFRHKNICSFCTGWIIETHDETGAYDSDGAQHWQKCSKCGAARSDAARTDHDWDAATGACKVCGRVQCTHEWGTSWKYDDAKHWHVCTKCGAAGTKESHRMEPDGVGKDPTCTENGKGTGVKCGSNCGYREEGSVTPALGHNYEDGVCTRCGESEPPNPHTT